MPGINENLPDDSELILAFETLLRSARRNTIRWIEQSLLDAKARRRKPHYLLASPDGAADPPCSHDFELDQPLIHHRIRNL